MITSRLAPLSLAAVLLTTACPEEEEEFRNGIVKLELRRGDGEDTDPYVGTVQITATLDYRECLQGYYMQNMSERQDGVDGELVFGTREQGGEGWFDLLCEQDLPAAIDCTVESLEQQLESGTPRLTVVYNVTGPIENRLLAVGPFPNREEAGCTAGALPEVRVGTSAVTGANSASATIWTTQTVSTSDAVVDQGGAIQIYAERSAT